MNKLSDRSWFGQIVLFIVLGLLFSTLPFLSALLLDKSSLTLAIFMAWYAAIPPIVLLVLAWLLYGGEANWALIAGRLCVSVGLWFGVQALLMALTGVHILLRLFALPSTLAGGKGFVAGAALFLLGGIVLSVMGRRLDVGSAAKPSRAVFSATAASLMALILVGLPSLIVLTSRSVPSIPADGPELPSEDEVFSYVSDLYDLGIRRPGWPATGEASHSIADRLEEFDFEEVHVEPQEFDLWKENTWSLTISPGTDDAWEADTFFVPYSGPTDPEGIVAGVVYVGEGTEEDFADIDVSGRIVLVSLPPVNIGWDQMKLFTYMAYDPDDTALGQGHPYPIGWVPKVIEVHDLAEANGAVGIIGILRDYPELGDLGFYAPYDGVLRQVPGLYVLADDGDRLIEQIESGPVEAQLVLDAEVSDGGGMAWTVYGVLPGQSDDIVMVHSHYDAPWRGGVEDSSGVGMVLGLARYYAQVPESERDHTMVFILMGSHMVGEPSNRAFMEGHTDDIMADLLVDVAIEHIANEYNPPEPPTGLVEPRGIFITENPVMVSMYAGAVVEHGSYRTLLFPTGTPLGVPTDAGMISRAGYPVSSLISGPVWLFDDDDTLDLVARDQLELLSAMYVDFIGRLSRVDARLLRFNLNVWTVALTAVLLTPLATVSAVYWPGGRKQESEEE
jgi:hypothetical protein